MSNTDYVMITKSDLEYTKQDIIRNDKIKLYDSSDNNLELYSYTECDKNSEPIVRATRGLILKENEVIFRGFSYTPEYSMEDLGELEELKNIINDKLGECKIFDSHEGTLLRFFYVNDKWVVSTHHRLDAFKSRWGSRYTFGNMFVYYLHKEYEYNENLQEKMKDVPDVDKMDKNEFYNAFLDQLDKNHKYMFFIKNNDENRLVCSTCDDEVPLIYHVGTYVENKLVFDYNVGLTFPHLHNFSSWNEIEEYVKDIDYMSLQGVILFVDDHQQYKILNKAYSQLKTARGNEPSVKFRYLKVRNNKDYVDALYYLYPKKVEIFEKMENTINEIGNYIYDSYIRRFIKKEYVIVPKEEYEVVKECHTWHLSDKSQNRISFEKVMEVLNWQHPSSLNKMIKRYRDDTEYDDQSNNRYEKRNGNRKYIK